MPLNNPKKPVQEVMISSTDLPLSCPRKGVPVWNAHPKVFLPLEQGQALCPYCSTLYLLKEDRH